MLFDQTKIHVLVEQEATQGAGFGHGGTTVALQLLSDGCRLSSMPLTTRLRTNAGAGQVQKTQVRGIIHGGTLLCLLEPTSAALVLPWACNRDTTGTPISCAIHVVDPNDEREYAGVLVGRAEVFALPAQAPDDTRPLGMRLDVEALTGSTASPYGTVGYPTAGPFTFARAYLTCGVSTGLVIGAGLTVANNLQSGRLSLSGPERLTGGVQEVGGTMQVLYDDNYLPAQAREGTEIETVLRLDHTSETVNGRITLDMPTTLLTQALPRGVNEPVATAVEVQFQAHRGNTAGQLIADVGDLS